MTTTQCKYCGEDIPNIRLKAIPGVETCVNCSDEQETIGFMIYSHKTAGEVQILKNPSEESKRQAINAYKRNR